MEIKYNKNNLIEAGIDEAGRGPLFGPVYAAAVIWDNKLNNFDEINLIKDSKKLTAKRRKKAYDFLKNNLNNYGVGKATSEEIDNINILEATKLAMRRAIKNLPTEPELLVIDGVGWENKFDIKTVSIVKGDDKYFSIAAASILAKEEHDLDILEKVKNNNNLVKYYQIDKNKGYGTKYHIEGIKNHGITEFHRKTFKPCCNYL